MRNEPLYAFLPTATGNLSVTTTSDRLAVPNANGLGRIQVRLYNAGAVPVFIAVGGSAVAATLAAGMPIPAGAVELISIADQGIGGGPYIAAITASSTATLYITTGEGF